MNTKIFLIAVVIVLLAFNVNAALNSSLAAGITTYWKLNETSGTTAYDVLGKFNLTVTAAQWNATGGIIGGAYFPNGNSGQHLDLNDSGDLTFNFWINRTAGIDTSFFFGTRGDTTNDWYLQSDAGNNLDLWGSNGNILNFPFDLGRYVMLTIVINSSTMTMYRNGTLFGSVAASRSASKQYHIWENAEGTFDFKGANVDEVSFYSRALSTAEVVGLWNNGAGDTYIPYAANLTITTVSSIFNNSIYETQNQTILVTISYDVSYSSIVGRLYYNDTFYTPTSSGNYNSHTFTTSVFAPIGGGSKSAVYVFDITNSTGTTQVNVSLGTQTVNQFYVSICNATNTVRFVNFTFKNEITNGVLNVTANNLEIFYSLSSPMTVNKSYTYTTTANYSNYSICSTAPAYKLYDSLLLQYSLGQATDYPQRRYRHVGSYTNVTTETNLLLIPYASARELIFQVLNPAGQPLEGVFVTASKSGSVMSSDYTGGNGGVTFWLDPNTLHTFTFSLAGYPILSKSIYPDIGTSTVYMGSNTTSDLYDYALGVVPTVTPGDYELAINTNYTFSLSIISTFWTISSFGFYIKNSSGAILTQATSSGSGTVSAGQNTINMTYIYMEAWWVANGTTVNMTAASWNIIDESQTTSSIKRFVTDLKNYAGQGMFGLDAFSLQLIIFIIIFLTVGTISYMSGIYSPTAVLGMVTAMVMVFDFGFGLITSPNGAVSHFPTIIISLITLTVLYWEVNR